MNHDAAEVWAHGILSGHIAYKAYIHMVVGILTID